MTEANDAENALMALLLTDPEPAILAMREAGLSPNDLRERAYYIVHAAYFLYDRGQSVDPTSVANVLRAQNAEWMRKDGDPFLDQLVGLATTGRADGRSLPTYIGMVQDAALGRRVSRRLQATMTDLRGTSPSHEALSALQYDLLELTRRHSAGGFKGMGEIVREYAPVLEGLIEHPQEITGLPTQSQTLNRLTAGIQQGEFWVVSAYPNLGKTSMALDLALKVALGLDYDVYFCSSEMMTYPIFQKVTAAQWRVPLGTVKTGRIPENTNRRPHQKEYVEGRLDEWRKNLQNTAEDGLLARLDNLRFIEASGQTIPELEAAIKTDIARRGKKDDQFPLAIFDYAQIIEPHRGQTQQEQVSHIAMALKHIAVRNGWATLVLSQLNDDGQVYMSRALHHACHVHVKIAVDAQEHLHWVVEKNRMGPKASIPMRFVGEFGVFEEVNS